VIYATCKLVLMMIAIAAVFVAIYVEKNK